MENKHIVTAEAVRKAHPDKLCDQIVDAILDAHLEQDSAARVAVEVFATNGKILIAGEVTSKAKVDYKKLVLDMLRELRYKPADLSSKPDGEIDLEVRVHEQSEDIAAAVDGDKEQGAGDQGIMVGYATNETPELLPLPFVLAQRICRELDRLQRRVSWLGADGKVQVSVVYLTLPERLGDAAVALNMAWFTSTGIRIAGMTATVPKNTVNEEAYKKRFDENTVNKFIRSTGIYSCHQILSEQTASDGSGERLVSR